MTEQNAEEKHVYMKAIMKELGVNTPEEAWRLVRTLHLTITPQSARGAEWRHFSVDVHTHVESYVVPQYGDAGADPVTDYTAAACVAQIEKYAKRHATNARPGQQRLDLLKIAHYACLAAGKLP